MCEETGHRTPHLCSPSHRSWGQPWPCPFPEPHSRALLKNLPQNLAPSLLWIDLPCPQYINTFKSSPLCLPFLPGSSQPSAFHSPSCFFGGGPASCLGWCWLIENGLSLVSVSHLPTCPLAPLLSPRLCFLPTCQTRVFPGTLVLPTLRAQSPSLTWLLKNKPNKKFLTIQQLWQGILLFQSRLEEYMLKVKPLSSPHSLFRGQDFFNAFL